jgi:hypothetical protein
VSSPDEEALEDDFVSLSMLTWRRSCSFVLLGGYAGSHVAV